MVGKPLNDLAKESNLTIMLIAGHETTATILSFVMFEVARKKELE